MRSLVASWFVLVLALILPATAQEEDIEWEEEDAATPLLESLRSLDPPLPCIVAEAEVVPTFEASTIRVALATEGCRESVTRDPGPEAPSALDAYVRILDAAERFIGEQGIADVNSFKVQFAALGWTADVDREAWKAADGGDGERLKAATSWTSTAADRVVRAPADLLAAAEDDDRRELNGETIAEVIRASWSSVMFCQQSRIDSTAGTRPRGEARVRLTIDARGSVRDPEVVESDFEDEGIDACLAERFGQMTFPESSTGEEFTITWPVKFD